MPTPAELHAAWVYTGEANMGLLQNHTICVDQNGKIEALVPSHEAPRNPLHQQIELPNHLLMPGLVNCHGHAAMTLLRGFADDLALTPWLQDHIWPTEGRWVDADFVTDGVNIAMAEMIKTGTTTFSDQYFFPDMTAQAASEAGMRCQVNFPVINVSTQWANSPAEYLSKGLAVRDKFKSSELISVIFGPHSPYSLEESDIARIATLANELDMGIQMHVHETKPEVLHAVEVNGERPIATLNRLGMLGPHMQCVHMVWLSKDDIRTIAETGTQVVHCPSSNMKLASGICPVSDLLAAGVNVSFGTDGAASNNGLNLFAELRLAALLAKLSSENPATLNAEQALYMATLGGAKALGLDHETGSLSVGKWADMIAISFDDAAMQPLHNPISQVVYAGHGAHVEHSWVAGRCLLNNGKLQTIDESEIIRTAQAWRRKIADSNDPTS
jgi:5-methylthioadenosine/S-adenosylhomocysteine deaminase